MAAPNFLDIEDPWGISKHWGFELKEKPFELLELFSFNLFSREKVVHK